MKKLMIGLLIGLMILSIACSSSPTAETSDAAVTIDKDLIITQKDVERNLALVKYNYMASYGPDYFTTLPAEEVQHITDDLVDEMITESLIIRETEKEGLEIDKAFMDDYYKQYMENTFGPAESPTESGKQIRTYLDENDIDDAFLRNLLERDRMVRQYIAKIQEDLEADEAKVNEMNDTMIAQVKASHILVGLDKLDLINDLYAQLKEDPSKFADLAKENSIDGSAANGGDLGYFTRGEMVVQFNDAAFAAEEGVVTEPVETQYGYHLILVTDKRTVVEMEAAGEAPEVIDLAKRNLIQDVVRTTYYDKVDELRENAEIERSTSK